MVARGRWLTYLDDDTLVATMAADSLHALHLASERTEVPGPIAVISGVQVIDVGGRRRSTRIPPPVRPRGGHFSLEPLELGCSYGTKQTLVVARDLFRRVGRDATFRSRVHTELFIRLNQECSIIGLPIVAYRLTEHAGSRVSTDPARRRESLERLEAKHRDLLRHHRSGYADLLLDDARTLLRGGRTGDALTPIARAVRTHPRRALPTAIRITGAHLLHGRRAG